MKFELKKIIPIIVSILALFFLCHFRGVPMSQFWKGYRVLYVYTDSLSAGDILTILEKNGADSVISSENQRLPFASALAPVESQNLESYISRRNDFFTDKSHRAHVFYIPENQSSQLEKSIRELSAFQSTSAGSDGTSSFPWIAPVIASLFFALFFSKKRILFFLGSAFFLILVFTRPLFTVAAAAELYFFAFFIFHRLWARKDFCRRSLNSPFVMIFALSPILILILSSPVSAVFYLLSLFASVSLLQLYYFYEKHMEESYSFKPLMIRSARMIPLVGSLGSKLLCLLLAFLLAVLLFFQLSGNVSSISISSEKPALPSPVSSSRSELVSLQDYMIWAWNSLSFPYKKIGQSHYEEPQDGESVTITDYQEVMGKIQPVENTVMVYNSEFRSSIYKSIDDLDYPAIEKAMLKQGKNTRYAYSQNSSASSSERFGIVLLMTFIALTASLGFYYIIRRRRYGSSI